MKSSALHLINIWKYVSDLPTKDNALYFQIVEDTKYYLYFQNCLGKLKGTYITL